MTNPESFADRAGQVWARLTWDGDRLVRLEAGGVAVDGTVIDDPLLGKAHRVGETTMSAIDWARPTEIPAIAAPGKLPAHAGGAILNALALLAERAGVAALRYAGPYPTAALYRALLRSFRTTASEADFTHDALARMARLARDPIAIASPGSAGARSTPGGSAESIDFTPAPHERRILPCGHAELRAALERAVLDGIAYERDGSPARLLASPGLAGARSAAQPRAESTDRAEVWFGDARYAHVATFAADGALLEHHALPACTSPVIGQAFPPALVGAIAQLVADAVPAPLATAAAPWLVAHTVCWADLGARAARLAGDTVEVHAAIWQHVGPYGLGRVALAIAEALVPVVAAAVTRET